MASSSFLIGFYLWSVVAMIIFPSTADATGEHRPQRVPIRPRCQGSIAECMPDGEFEMESPIHGRILATSQYLSYQALQRNTVPCSQKGASYYNCKPGAQANPYSRGCDCITRCRTA